MSAGNQTNAARTVLHLIPTLSSGGAERQLALLAREQARAGARVHVAVRRGGSFERGLRQANVWVHGLGDHRGVNPRLLGRCINLIRILKPDVVQSWLPQMDIVAGISTFILPTPWVVSERSSAAAYSERSARTFIREKLSLRADAIVANSKAGLRYWAGVRATDSGLFHVQNAIDFKELTGVLSAPPIEGTPGNCYLFVGRLMDSKGLTIVLRALQALATQEPLHLLVFGAGPSLDRLKAEAKSLGLADKVRFMGHRPDWWRYLPMVRGLISPSLYEGSPNVALEAAAANCPLFLSEIPEHREVFGAEGAIYFDPRSAESLAAAILNAKKHPDLTTHASQRARATVESFQPSHTELAMREVYEFAIASRARLKWPKATRQ
jgi:glycosyltransferase involved in cell wall biosynthesis